MTFQREARTQHDTRGNGRRLLYGRIAAPTILVLLICGYARPAAAACSGSSPTRTAASASRTDVNDCVSAAASGDTIRVPAGSASWSSPLGLPETKDLTIIGSGIGVTLLTCSSGDCFNIHLGASHRIAGFTMTGPGGGVQSTGNNNQNPSKHFRIDHNRIVSTSGWESMEFYGATNGVHPQGIVDNNQFLDVAVHANGTNFGLDEGNYQHVLWSQPTPLGDSSGIVYIEANSFQGTTGNINFADSNYGGRYVFRFNTGTGRGYVEVHSVQGLNRASQRTEIYKNTFTFSSASAEWPGIAFIRGGSGTVFGNRLVGAYGIGLTMDNVRSEGDPGGGVGRCNGTSNWDGNMAGQSGYPCRDQIGRAYDTSVWAPGRPYAQVLQPVYMWDNLVNGSAFDTDDSGLSTWIRQNRDYYTASSSFNGTTGVGQGPIASRPATCTTGVAYWATNEGEWNSAQAGPDGRLYKCTSTNNWTLYYTPFQYPHPWQSGGAVPQTPAPPTNLRIITALMGFLPVIAGVHALQCRSRRRR